MTLTPSIYSRVHSRVLDCGREEIRLWYFARAINLSGSGRVCVTTQQLRTFFGNGQATIYRWLARGEGVLWHRDDRVRDRIVLNLIGIRQVCRNLNLGLHKNVLGAIADVPLKEIASRFGTKGLATHLDALQCQRQAWWAASQSVPESIRHFVLKPWEKIASVKSTGSESDVKATKQIDRYAFESGDWTIPGATISGIRKRTDWRSDRTIQRRLSDKCRADHGLESLSRKRVAAEVTDPNTMALLAQSSSGYLVENNRVYKVLKGTSHEFFLLKHNIYGAGDIQLLGLRRLRAKVNRYLKIAITDINTGQK